MGVGLLPEVVLEIELTSLELSVTVRVLKHGQAVDLSYSGLRGRVDLSLDQMSDLKLSLSSGMMSGQAEEIYAKVLKVIPHDQGGCEIFMEFTSMPTGVNEVIRRYVDRIVEGS